MTISIDQIAQLLWLQTWQTALVAALLLPTAYVLGKRRPQIALLLCFLVLGKALTPPVFAHRASLVQWLNGVSQPAEKTASVREPVPVLAPPANEVPTSDSDNSRPLSAPVVASDQASATPITPSPSPAQAAALPR